MKNESAPVSHRANMRDVVEMLQAKVAGIDAAEHRTLQLWAGQQRPVWVNTALRAMRNERARLLKNIAAVKFDNDL